MRNRPPHLRWPAIERVTYCLGHYMTYCLGHDLLPVSLHDLLKTQSVEACEGRVRVKARGTLFRTQLHEVII